MKEVPRVSKTIGIVCLVINIILPGIGTMVAACADQAKMVPKSQIFIGFLQFFTVYFLFFGWIWSIYWGYLIFQESRNEDPITMGGKQNELGSMNSGGGASNNSDSSGPDSDSSWNEQQPTAKAMAATA